MRVLEIMKPGEVLVCSHGFFLWFEYVPEPKEVEQLVERFSKEYWKRIRNILEDKFKTPGRPFLLVQKNKEPLLGFDYGSGIILMEADTLDPDIIGESAEKKYRKLQEELLQAGKEIFISMGGEELRKMMKNVPESWEVYKFLSSLLGFTSPVCWSG